MTKPPTTTRLFSGEDIDLIHKDVTAAIVEDGKDIIFGHEEKHARDTCMTIHIWGKGIKRLLNGSTPKGFPFGGEKLKEFNRQGVMDETNPFAFVYTYQGLLRKPGSVFGYADQLSDISMKLKRVINRGVGDNGMVAVLFHPNMFDWDEKPCWNWLQVTYLGNNKISLRLLFRSHDYGTAMPANLSFILNLLRHFVARPNNCEIVEVILFSSSAHIYEGDADNAEKVSGIPWLKDDNKGVLGKIWSKICGLWC